MTAEKGNTNALSASNYRTLARFRYALRLFQRFSEDAARSVGLTPAQHQLMLAVKGWDGPDDPTIGDLAEKLQLRHHSTVELVQRASGGDLVTTISDAHDGRVQRVVLTTTGEELLSSLSVTHRDELRRFRAEMADLLEELG